MDLHQRHVKDNILRIDVAFYTCRGNALGALRCSYWFLTLRLNKVGIEIIHVVDQFDFHVG